jgi:uncharacterized protein YjbI with pentapeptide repeats
VIELKENILDKEFSEEIFEGLTALNIKVNNCIFDSCKFKDCNFSTIDIKNSSFTDCEFKNCKVMGIDWSYINPVMGFSNSFHKCDLSYSVFLNLDLRGMELYDCKLKESSFESCNMSKCVLKNCDFELVRFVRDDLRETDFRESYNYVFDIEENKVEKAKFNTPEVLNLLKMKKLEID